MLGSAVVLANLGSSEDILDGLSDFRSNAITLDEAHGVVSLDTLVSVLLAFRRRKFTLSDFWSAPASSKSVTEKQRISKGYLTFASLTPLNFATRSLAEAKFLRF